MVKAGLLVLLYPLLLAVLLQSCHGQERKVNCCSLKVQSYSTWDDSLENNLYYVHAGSHCIHGSAASGRFSCFINAPFHARKSTWKVKKYTIILKENIIKWKIKTNNRNNKIKNKKKNKNIRNFT
jgi:hypothetical protein